VTPSDPGVELRPLAPADADALRAFFARIPEGDRTFFKEDVDAPGTLTAWVMDTRARRLLAVVDGDVAGYLAVLPGVGWSAHVAELRLVVDPARRRLGIGRALARAGLVTAVELGVKKLTVEVVTDQEPVVALFQGLGFEAEGLLRDHVCDRQGELHDLLVLAHAVDDTWSLLSMTGIETELG
jgi:ribosomal protein S18 acetylase RimI-like enzyme